MVDPAHSGREGKAGNRNLCMRLVFPLLKQGGRTLLI